MFTLFAQRLPNDSFFQTPPLRDANLLWLVDFNLKQCLWAFNAPRAHLVAKNEFAFSFRPKENQVFPGLHIRDSLGASAKKVNDASV